MKVIPFPSWRKVGQSRKVAYQLAKARSEREASHLLSRAVQSHVRQLLGAGIEASEVERQRGYLLAAIHSECVKVGAVWVPGVRVASDDGGAA